MISAFVNEAPAWAWLVLGILLCAGETLAPGMFLLWIGLAAILTGLVLFIVPLGLAWSLIVFGIAAVVCVAVGRKFYGSVERGTDRPFLNRRAEALIGKTFILDEPIRDGFGRIRVNDSIWRVRGPNLPAGTQVRVDGLEDGVLLRVVQA